MSDLRKTSQLVHSAVRRLQGARSETAKKKARLEALEERPSRQATEDSGMSEPCIVVKGIQFVHPNIRRSEENWARRRGTVGAS